MSTHRPIVSHVWCSCKECRPAASSARPAAAAPDSPAPSRAPEKPPAESKKAKNKKNKKQPKNSAPAASGRTDLLYTNTGAVDLVLASDGDGITTWIKDVKPSRLQPGMRLVSMEAYDPDAKRMTTRNFADMPFLDVVKEVEAQNIVGTEGGISPFHLKFDPDPGCPPFDELATAKLVRMEGKYEKEVIDVLEAIDRGTAG